MESNHTIKEDSEIQVDSAAQVATKGIVDLLNGLPLQEALLSIDIAKAWLPAQSYVQSLKQITV